MRGLVALGAAVVMLAGCSSDPVPPATLPPLTSSPTPSPTPVPTPTGINAPDAFGASAFTKHFFAQVNQAYSQRDPELIRVLAAVDCETCENFMADIARLIKERRRVEGGAFELLFAESPPPEDGVAIVEVAYSNSATRELSESGSVVKTYPARPRTFGQVRLDRTPSGWAVRAIREVKAP
jgi:hypothetical protein